MAQLRELVVLARAAASVPADPILDRVSRAQLVERMRSLPSTRRSARRGLESIPRRAWLATLLLVIGGFVWGLASRPVRYAVDGVAPVSDYVRASDGPVELAFSDGTRITVDTSARLRVDQMRSRGARILIERGRIFVRVPKRLGGSWSFAAGPFEMAARASDFVLDWDSKAERLDLWVDSGAIEVGGPIGPRTIPVRSGHHLQVIVPTQRLSLSEQSGDASGVDLRELASRAIPLSADGAESAHLEPAGPSPSATLAP